MKKWCIFLFNSFLILVLSAAGVFSQPANVLRADATVNVSDTVVFRLNDYVGEHIKWQFSHNLSDWTDISGATTDSLMFVADTTTHFRAKVIAGDCDPFFSDTLKIKVIHQDDQGIVVDIDGNVYPTVIIGNQRWMSQNLRVTRYTNGNLIPTGLSHSEWHGTTSGAYAIYSIGEADDDDIDPPEEMAEAYGKLYNWYAVDDARGLCPAGWRVPSDDDWTELVNYVIDQGFPNINTSINGTGNALKSCRQVGSPMGDECDTSEHPRWNYPHNHNYGFDEFGFSALPGGMWGDDIGLLGDAWGSGLGRKGHWWSATAFGSPTAWYRAIRSGNSTIARSYTGKNDGFSVRCVRNLKEFSLYLETDPENAGSVTGAGNHLEGAQVDIIAAAFAGWEFVAWTGDTDYVDDPASANAAVTMPAKTITLTANFQPQEDHGTVTDIDGNVYNIILVDDQKWLVENLRVTRYNNGDSITTGLNDSQWSNTSSGAYAIFDHDDSSADGIDSPEEMVTAYGKLYNWWAVDDPRGLCPEGWRAPSDDESKAMEMFLGMDVDEVHNSGWRGVDEGGKLKSMRTEPERHPRWNLPNTLASDEIRFSLFPSGFREHHGGYTSLGHASLYWTSTSNAGVSAWYRTHSAELGTIGRFFGWNNYGFSVRCVKEPVTYNLQLDNSPENAGNVSGAGEYTEGKEVNIEAFSNPGWRFLEWTGDTDYLVDPTATTAWMHYMSNYSGRVSHGYTNTSRALSLRCIKSPSAP